MQIKHLHKKTYKLYSLACKQDRLENGLEKYQEGVLRWDKLKAEGVTDRTCYEITGISRATYFRHKKILTELHQGIFPPSKRPKRLNKPRWGESEKQKVLRIRRENPTYGKGKIAVILRRDQHLSLSESTVGRILKQLKAKGLIQTSPSSLPKKRRRNFTKGHAKPWVFKAYTDIQMGERVQIDHMTVTRNGVCLKHFQAWDRCSKYIHANVYSNAKSSSAKRFLLELIQLSPFPILSIQVDGGSEFMAEFEAACQELNIPLLVLPPRKPQYNGGVERGNRTFQEEFYYKSNLLADTVSAFRVDLKKAIDKYNAYRPHANLKGRTPLEYIQSTYSEAAA